MPNLKHERSYTPRIVCGVDEAGCGPWAGPVVAAAVIFPGTIKRFPSGLNDSKQVKRETRESLFSWIQEKGCIGIGQASVEEIDTLNIYHAALTAMQRAVTALAQIPEVALIDGNRRPKLTCETITIIRGDCASYSIAAASIIAKVTRDRIMAELHDTYPQYGFARHVGYGTKFHQEALRTHGPSPIHRRSFAPIRALLEIAS